MAEDNQSVNENNKREYGILTSEERETRRKENSEKTNDLSDVLKGLKLPIANYNFIVLMGPFRAGFNKITGIGSETEIDYYSEGGNNGSPIYLPRPKKGANKIIFEQGVGSGGIFSEVSGVVFDQVLNYLPGIILVLDREYKIKNLYILKNLFVISWEISELNAMGNDVLINKLTCVHNGLISVPKADYLGKLVGSLKGKNFSL